MIGIETVKLEIFVPDEYVPALREALAGVGVGQIGNYDHCVSITQVSGYWRPLPGARPFAGEVGQISFGTESKIEANCPVSLVKPALAAIRAAHPYDEPLINVVPLLNHLLTSD